MPEMQDFNPEIFNHQAAEVTEWTERFNEAVLTGDAEILGNAIRDLQDAVQDFANTMDYTIHKYNALSYNATNAENN